MQVFHFSFPSREERPVPKRYGHFIIDSCKGEKKISPCKNLGLSVDKSSSLDQFRGLRTQTRIYGVLLESGCDLCEASGKNVLIMAPIIEDRTCHSLEVWRTSTDPILLSFFVAFGNNLLLQCDKCSPHHYFQSVNLSLPARAVCGKLQSRTSNETSL